MAGVRDGRERSLAVDQHRGSVAGRRTRQDAGRWRSRLVCRPRRRLWRRRRRQRPC